MPMFSPPSTTANNSCKKDTADLTATTCSNTSQVDGDDDTAAAELVSTEEGAAVVLPKTTTTNTRKCRPKARCCRKKRSECIATLMVTAMPLGFLVFVLVFFFRDVHHQLTWGKTNGTVVDIVTATCGGGTGPAAVPSYDCPLARVFFELPNGRNVTVDAWKPFEGSLGDGYDVLYDPRNPGDAVSESSNRASIEHHGRLSLVLVATIAVVVLIGCWCCYCPKARRRAERQLQGRH